MLAAASVPWLKADSTDASQGCFGNTDPKVGHAFRLALFTRSAWQSSSKMYSHHVYPKEVIYKSKTKPSQAAVGGYSMAQADGHGTCQPLCLSYVKIELGFFTNETFDNICNSLLRRVMVHPSKPGRSSFPRTSTVTVT